MGWCRSLNMPHIFCNGKRQGVPYSHGKKSAQKIQRKHIFLEHDINDKTIPDDDIVLCPSLLVFFDRMYGLCQMPYTDAQKVFFYR